MNNTLLKGLKFFLGGLLLVAVLMAIAYFNAVGNLHPEASFDQQDEQLGNLINFFMYFAYALVFIAIALTLLFSIAKMVLQPKTAIKSIGSIVFLAIIALIGWSLGSDDILNIPGYGGTDNVAGTLRFSDMILYTMYIMSGISFVVLIYAEVSKLFK